MKKSNHAKLMDGRQYRVSDRFYGRLMEVVKDSVIPYQWEALNDRVEGAAKSYCIANFKAAAGELEAEHRGCVFQDSDLAKWIEAASLSLMWREDPALEAELDGVIALIARAQREDGYMGTYYILNGLDKRWTNLRDNHELYCIGHFVEAAVAHYRATGKNTLLEIMEKCVQNVIDTFGREEGKLRGYPGHEEIELALVKLCEATGKAKYLELASFFIDERGSEPLYFTQEALKNGKPDRWTHSALETGCYRQADRPVREQTEPEGHSVRANYLYAGMAAIARETGDETLFRACRTLWDNMINKYMYITGQIGSSEFGEAFTFPYDLPNDTVYGETCAGLALAFFAQRMLQIERKAEYADVIERLLYNGALSGMSLDGKSFFYVNPLEVYPEASWRDGRKQHVKPERLKWFGCACCPPNLARTIASVAEYACSYTENELFQHLYIAGEISRGFGGREIKLALEGGYPWDGDIKITVQSGGTFTYALRIPGWCGSYALKINGRRVSETPADGYVYLSRQWQDGDVIELSLPMPAERVYANLNVREDIGKVAIQRGPIVYCLEECDNGNKLHRIFLERDAPITASYEPELLGGVTVLSAAALYLEETGNKKTGGLYTTAPEHKFISKEIKMIPYYAWTNRSPGEMLVWIRELSARTSNGV